MVLGILLRGMPHAVAQPAAVDLVPTVVAGEGHCHDAASHAPLPSAAVHDQGACKIACELGAAPAMTMVPMLETPSVRPVRVARVPALIQTERAPPDHPPPI